MAIDPDTGIREGDQFGKTGPGEDQHDYKHGDSGNSGGSKTREGGPGTAGSVPPVRPGNTGGQEE